MIINVAFLTLIVSSATFSISLVFGWFGNLYWSGVLTFFSFVVYLLSADSLTTPDQRYKKRLEEKYGWSEE